MIISALLLGILIPVFDLYFNVEKNNNRLSMAEESKLKNIKELKRLAEKSFYEGNYQGAENYYSQLISLAPFELESRRNLAVIYNEQNKLEAKNQVLLETAILSHKPEDYLSLAVNFYQRNNNIASNYILNYKLNNDQSRDQSFKYQKYYYLIKNYLALKNIEQAEKYLMEITNLDLNKSEIYLLSAELNKLKGNYEQAYNNYKKSYQENRTQTYLYREMALMLAKAGREKDAYNHWQKNLGYGWYQDLAYQQINYYQNKYPDLKADKEKKGPAEINPFSLQADWKEAERLKTTKKDQMLRIGLQDDNKTLLFQYSDPFSIIQAGKIIFRGQAKKSYLLKIESDSLFIITAAEKIRLGSSRLEYEFYSSRENSSFYVFNINYGQGYFWQGSADRQYRGEMIIKAQADRFSLINKVELSSYLAAVVPSEIYASWPREALKAQAVAARSYTLNNLGRHSSEDYDLCSSVHCAAYNGIRSEDPRTTTAVLATEGEAAYFEGRVIEAVFSSNSGGVTERSDQIWSADLTYLRGANQMKTDNYKFPLSPVELRSWLLSSPASYSKDFGSSNYRWQLEVPAQVIEYRSKMAVIKKIEVKKRAQRGTITSLTISGENEKGETLEKSYSVSQIRRVLGGLKSSRFYLNSHYDQNHNLKSIYLYGSGWGHNLGLDQSAAAGMGRAGFSYQQIIKHFYPGVEIKN